MPKLKYLRPVLLIVAGMVLLFLSIVLPRLAQPGESWSPEKAQALQDAWDELERLGKEDAAEEQMQAATERYQQLYSEFQGARGAIAVVALPLQMLGVGLGLIGAVWLIMLQNEAEDARKKSA